jgi:hypothetical protein
MKEYLEAPRSRTGVSSSTMMSENGQHRVFAFDTLAQA